MRYEVEYRAAFYGGNMEVVFSRLTFYEVKAALNTLVSLGYINSSQTTIEAALDEVASMEAYDIIWPYSGVTIAAY